MDSLHQDVPLTSDDLSALAWVHDELRKSLDSAHKALHRCLKDATSAGVSDLDALDPAILRTARQQIHQGVGALELAGMTAGATLLRASEAVVQKFVNRPQSINEEAVRDIEKASFALLDYISRRLGGKEVSAMALFPQYEALTARVGSVLPRPTDLWSQDWPSLSLEAPLAAPESVPARHPEAATIDDFETGLLRLLRRNRPEDAEALAELCASLARDAQQRAAHRETATWMLASGFLEGVAGRHVPLGVHAKRVLSSLLSQLRVLAKGNATPSDRLANELLFFCAQASNVPAGEQTVLARVRRTFGLDRHKPVDLQSSPLGRHDPSVIAQALKRVAGAKDGWSAVAAGELLRMGGLSEQFSLVSDSLRRLFPHGQALADALSHAVDRTVESAKAPEPPLAMEVATSLLYVEASLEDGEFEHEAQQSRVDRLAARIDGVSAGQPAQPLEAWMEDLYRRVSDRQTMGSVVQELRNTLGECEKNIDQFFRDPQERTPLINVPSQLQAIRGVLAVLGLDVAAQAAVRMREAVEHLLVPDADLAQAASEGVFDRLATNLGALGFLIDMMGVQPALAKSLFRMDEATGVLSPVMGREKKTHLTPDDPVEAVAQHVHQVQREEAQAVAEEVVEALERHDAPLSEVSEQVSEQLQKLAGTAHVQEQEDLASTVAAAQAALASAQATDDKAVKAAALEQVQQALQDFTQSVSDTETLDEGPAFPPPPPLDLTPVAAPESTGLEEDDEMREIFLEEAREVIDTAREALATLATDPADVGALTAVRRGFHTLKGSSRMVGLKAYGDAAWACEQLYNAWLASQDPASLDLRLLTAELLDHFAAWTDAIVARQDRAWSALPVIRVADALRLHGRRHGLGDADESAAAASAESGTAASGASEGRPPLTLAFDDEPATIALPRGHAEPESGPASEPTTMALVPDGQAAEPLSLPADEPSTIAMPRPAAEQAAETVELIEPMPLLGEPQAAHVGALPEGVAVSNEHAASPEAGRARSDGPQAPLADDAAGTLGLHEKIVLDLDAVASDEGVTTAQAIPARSQSEGAVPSFAPDAAAQAAEAESEAGAQSSPDGEMSLHEPVDVTLLDEAGTPTVSADLYQPHEGRTHETRAGDHPPGGAPTPSGEGAFEPRDSGVQPSTDASSESDDQIKVVGPLRISIPLFNIYLNEADEQSRRLSTALSEWALELHHPVSGDMIALAHSLAGNSATVGYTELSQLARLLEHALMRSQHAGPGDDEAARLFNEAAEEIRRLLHQFAAGFLKTPADDLMRRLEWYDHEVSRRSEAHGPVAEAAAGDAAAGDAADTGAPVLHLVKSPDAEADERPHLHVVHAGDEPEPTQPAPLGVAEFKPLESLPTSTELLSAATGAQAVPAGAAGMVWDDESDIDAQDNVDPDLFPIFEEEAQELLPQLANQARQWLDAPHRLDAAAACMRTLHTFKGGARLAGAMRLGELAHRIESSIERLIATPHVERGDVEPLEARVDRLVELFELLRHKDAERDAQRSAETVAAPDAASREAAPALNAAPGSARPADASALAGQATEGGAVPAPAHAVEAAAPDAAPDTAGTAPQTVADKPAPDGARRGEAAARQPRRSSLAREQADVRLEPIDWASLGNASTLPVARVEREAAQGPSQAVVRVRPQLLDRLVNHAGEVSITRTRLQAQVGQIRGSLTDLTENLDRLRQQLRDIELQAETQLSTRMEAARQASQEFDPLEFDRYTRFQELTRMMAESVNDVATVQRTLQRNLETAEDQLAAQARLTRDLQDDLLRTRMVEFEGLSDRLYRVVRQAAKETGKQVRLDIVGGATEIDRGVLERMTGSFEHLLRNCITHGIEPPAERTAAGKDATGQIIVALRHEGNEVSIEFRDDGAGLNLDRIRARGQALGLLAPDATATEAELSQLIFTPGFSTADTVTELAGRGIGMDVVRSEVNAMGGRIETATAPGRGTSFTLVLPLTTAVTKVVMLRCGDVSVAVPTHLIEMVRRARAQEVEEAYARGSYGFADLVLPFYWLGALLEHSPRGLEGGRSIPVVIVRSAQQRVALHVDEVLGNQEVVVKNLGQQLSRLPGLAGMTLLASGAVSLIYNPVALATVYGDKAQAWTAEALAEAGPAAAGWLRHEGKAPASVAGPSESETPLVLVVDDSLTVRKVTQRLLAREGYRVNLAKDGLEALELLDQERPAVILSDIEMPRMDGFDLVRNIRANPRLADMPVIMITSRIAQKHRDYATELGVNHYLGKPYGEEELLSLVARYAGAQQPQPVA